MRSEAFVVKLRLIQNRENVHVGIVARSRPSSDIALVESQQSAISKENGALLWLFSWSSKKECLPRRPLLHNDPQIVQLLNRSFHIPTEFRAIFLRGTRQLRHCHHAPILPRALRHCNHCIGQILGAYLDL